MVNELNINPEQSKKIKSLRRIGRLINELVEAEDLDEVDELLEDIEIKVKRLYNFKKGGLYQEAMMIQAFDKDTGEKVGEWPSQLKASKELKVDQIKISNCVNGHRKTVDGYVFKKVKKKESE